MTIDDHTVKRIITLYSEQLDDLWLHETQLARWKKDGLSGLQEKEVDRLMQQLPKLKATGERILELARIIDHGTIDKILNMSDVDLALAVLSGKIKPPEQ